MLQYAIYNHGPHCKLCMILVWYVFRHKNALHLNYSHGGNIQKNVSTLMECGAVYVLTVLLAQLRNSEETDFLLYGCGYNLLYKFNKSSCLLINQI